MYQNKIDSLRTDFINRYNENTFNDYYARVYSDNKLFKRMLNVVKKNEVPTASNLLLVILFDKSLILANEDKIILTAALLLSRWNAETNIDNKLASDDNLITILNQVKVELEILSAQ